jgi:hypothetical protein
MASTFTTNFAIEKPATGEQSGSWGTTTNHNFDIFDRLAGYKSVTVSGTTHTLTVRPSSPSSGSSNAQDGMYRVIEFVDSGSDLGGDVTLTIAPNSTQAFFFFKNSLTSDRNIVVTQGSGSNVTVPGSGKVSIVFGDGGGSSANVISISDTLAMSNPEITGGVATGLTDLSMANAAAQAKAQTGLNVDAAGTAVALSIALG